MSPSVASIENLMTLFDDQILFKLKIRSMRMDRAKMAKYVRWGMTSSIGTGRGKWKNWGSRTVRTGMDRSRFDGWCWNRIHASFVLSMIERKVRKEIHSNRIIVRFVMLIPVPYQLLVMGQRSCVPSPVR